MGLLRERWIADAFDRTDRTRFVPDRIRLPGDSDSGRTIDRTEEPEAWAAAVWDPHTSVVTQLDDGATPLDHPGGGDFTSSVSALDIVLEKLHHLDLRGGHRVLEIGTGSGYHTALLAHRTSQVTTVEVDPRLYEQARKNLSPTPVHLVLGDATTTVPEGPYDRIISTAAVHTHLPDAWRAQASHGAVVVAPYTTALVHGGALLVLDGYANCLHGRFAGSASYMLLRAHRPAPVDVSRLPDAYETHRSPIDPEQVIGRGWGQTFALSLALPGIGMDVRTDDDGRRLAQLWDRHGSVTVLNIADWRDEGAVTWWGPRNLWAEAIEAYARWRADGQPHFTRYGITVVRDRHVLWLDVPGKRVLTF
ncbi:methyltransferase domain-containing protein [Streptomyces luteolus]|uniref:Protein-L-isoaspartate O-methyltransferase n=1 Tax=Streptomyces luteolus TaxID=3043615 RepID=A0ABT6T4Y5_9ACTN|nr:methyltransferase domain-containing protein [Streptomyces sp. B-S-A12]MDI3422894.1 methyltransferase domain-containing protein [Streptomyces sp. B-S-A12]